MIWQRMEDISAHVMDGYEEGDFGLMPEHMQFFIGNMMVSFDVLDGSQSSAIKVVNPLCQGLCEGPHSSPYWSLERTNILLMQRFIF